MPAPPARRLRPHDRARHPTPQPLSDLSADLHVDDEVPGARAADRVGSTEPIANCVRDDGE